MAGRRPPVPIVRPVRQRRRNHGADALVESVIRHAEQPLSTYQVRDLLLARGHPIAVPQVYRIVARLVDSGRIRRIETLNAYIPASAGADAIAICAQCSAAFPIPIGDLAPRILDLFAEQGFAATGMVIEVRGRCAACRSRE